MKTNDDTFLLLDPENPEPSKKVLRFSSNVKIYSMVGYHKVKDVLNDDEFKRYENNKLTQDEWLSLFIRGLAEEGDTEVDLDFPIPANYPSVIVVNITTGCNSL